MSDQPTAAPQLAGDICPATATLHDRQPDGTPFDINLTCDIALGDHITVVNHHDPARGDWADFLRTTPMPDLVP